MTDTNYLKSKPKRVAWLRKLCTNIVYSFIINSESDHRRKATKMREKK